MREKRLCNIGDQCGHTWVATAVIPAQCAKCRSRRWNVPAPPSVRRNTNGMIYKDPATCYHPASKRVGGKCLVCGSILSSTGPADLEPGSVSNLDKMLID